MHKTQFVFPIIGGRKIEHLVSNLEALDISLTPEHLKFLDSVAPFDVGFPHSMIVRSSFLSRSLYVLLTDAPLNQGDGTTTAIMGSSTGHIRFWPRAQPISGAPSR